MAGTVRRMADYTIVNLREVEDKAPQFGYAPHLQSRFAREALGLRNQGLSLFTVEPGFRIPFGHRHAEQEEVYGILRGSVRLRVEDELLELGAGDAIGLPPTLARGLEAGAD